MKLGIIFKKEFQDTHDIKQEFFGDEITITRATDINYLYIKTYTEGNIDDNKEKLEKFTFPIRAIQLIYLGGWNK